MVTMVTVILESYGYLGDTLNHMKNTKLASFISENVTNCCVVVVYYADILDRSVTIKPDYLDYISRVL